MLAAAVHRHTLSGALTLDVINLVTAKALMFLILVHLIALCFFAFFVLLPWTLHPSHCLWHSSPCLFLLRAESPWEREAILQALCVRWLGLQRTMISKVSHRSRV